LELIGQVLETGGKICKSNSNIVVKNRDGILTIGIPQHDCLKIKIVINQALINAITECNEFMSLDGLLAGKKWYQHKSVTYSDNDINVLFNEEGEP
jgi:hypothetical protein